MISRPTFMEGVLVAFIVSISSTALYALLTWFFSEIGVIQVVVSVVSFSYVIYMLVRSPEKSGRIVVTCAWTMFALVIWVIDLPLGLFCLAHVGMLWLVRSLYYYSSFISSLLDFGLVSVSLMFSVWAFYQTDSVFMSLWSFFLMQALFVLIPVKHDRSVYPKNPKKTGRDDFDLVFMQANEAVQKIMSAR